MGSFRTGYRILITNYGYYGSFGSPYVMYEILERDEDLSSVEKIIDQSLSQYAYTNACPLTSLSSGEKLEHLVIAIQNKYNRSEYTCFHQEILDKQLRRIPEKTSIIVPLINRVYTAEIVDHVLEAIGENKVLSFEKELVEDLTLRLPDPFIAKILKILENVKIPIHDVEDDSRLLAIGEGKHCLVIYKQLTPQKNLLWIKYPFPTLDTDEILENELNHLNVERLLTLDLIPLKTKLITEWVEFKLLLEKGTVPKHLISGTNGKTTTARMIAHIIREVKRHKIGMTSTSGIFIDGEEPDYGDFTGPWSARQLLLQPIDEAVLETARGGLIREGVIFERVNTAILTNVAADHIGLRDIVTVEQMADLKSLIYLAATDCIVVNLDEKQVMNIYDKIKRHELQIQQDCEVWGITTSGNSEPGIKNLISLDVDQVKLVQGENSIILGSINEFSFSDNGIISFMNVNALGALAVAIGYGMEPKSAFEALLTFKADVSNAPGRGNFFESQERHFMLDYGHNPHALLQIKKTIQNIRSKYGVKRVIYLALTAGDRREEDLREYGRILATFPVDIVIFKDLWVDRRGKAEGEVGLLVGEELVKSGFKGTIYQKPDPVDAITHALKVSRPGDLVYLCAEKADIMMNMINEFEFNNI